MLKKVKQFFSRSQMNVPVAWIRKDRNSWLCQHLMGKAIKAGDTIYSSRIEKLAEETNNLGPQPIWQGYGDNTVMRSTRVPNDVRTPRVMGNLYTYLVQKRQPNVVVEFGTAFGISGMYFLAGIESNQTGKLLTFEPNDAWREVAVHNLSQISNHFDSIAGTFEDNIADALPRGQGIDLAFIDAIHTKEFVLPQLEIVLSRSSDNAIIILDDINFSESMKECWKEVSMDIRFSCSAALGRRVGILELSGSRRNQDI